MRKIKNKGFTLVEMLIVLAIILALSVAAFFIYKNVSQKSQLNKEVEHLSLIKSSLDSISNFGKTTLDTELFKSIEITDNSKGDILDTWKSPIIISKSENSSLFYDIKYSNLNKYNCINLANDFKTVFGKLSVNDTIISNISVSALTDDCNSESNTLTFSNYKKVDGDSSSSNSGGNTEDTGNSKGEETKSDAGTTLTPEEYAKQQQDLLDNSPWDSKIITQMQSGYDDSGNYVVQLDNAGSTISSSDSAYSGIISKYIDSNKGTISTSDFQNYVMSLGDGASDIIDGKSLTFTDSPVPKSLCYSKGFSCNIAQSSDGKYTTKVTFSKAAKFS
jgi:prepilin-type N-terminal cleavage/methylation domain-containing protein